MARSTLRTIAEEIAFAFEPLADATESLEDFQGFMYRFGWTVQSIPAAYTTLGTQARDVVLSVQALLDDPEFDEIVDALEDVRALVTSIRTISAVPDGIDSGDVAEFLAEIGEAIIDALLVEYLRSRAEMLHGFLLATGVITETYRPATPTRAAFVETDFAFGELKAVLDDPTSIPERVYGWGTADFDFDRMLQDLLSVIPPMDLDVRVEEVDDKRKAGYLPAGNVGRLQTMLVVRLFERWVGSDPLSAGVAVVGLPSQGGEPAGIVIEPFAPSDLETNPVEIAPGLTLTARAGSDLLETVGFVIRPNDLTVTYPFQPGRPFPLAGFGITLDWSPEDPVTIIGRPAGTRIEVGRMESRLDVNVRGADLELAASFAPKDLALVLDGGDLDNFVGAFLGDGATIPVPIVIRWSSKTGLAFDGARTFRAEFAPHVELGPVAIEKVGVQVSGVEDPDGAELAVTVGAGLSLGPIDVAVEGFGLALRFTEGDGNFGPFSLSLGFKPPLGAGVAIDAGPVKGGGFLSYDDEIGRYAGALELDAFGVAINALGVLDTRIEGGGWSLVGIVSSEFVPIQLGLGFTLNGVGGLVAVNRRIDVQALESAVFGPGLADVFFADDLIRQASRLAGEWGTYFPVAQGRYVFGPAAKIGWGTPQLISADVAILLEVPSPVRVIVLGHAHAALPSESAKLIELNFDILGTIEFERKTFEIYAQLRDSKVLGFTIEGGLGLKIWWGDPPNFVFSVGGLSPRFPPPAGFRVPQPLRIPLGFDDDPRLDVTGYLALTPNSAQIGANVELYASASALNIRGHFDFDALFVWSPFSVTVDIDASVQLRRNSTVLAGIGLHGTLTGPGPWKVKGKACLSCWFVDLCVPFSASFGGSADTTAPQLDPWVDLEAAIVETRNWAGNPVARQFRSVVLGKAIGAVAPPIDPSGNATFRQNVIPLDRKLNKYQNARPIGPDRYKLTEVLVGGKVATKVVVKDWLAPDQFEDLSDDERLTRGSYERMVTGVTIASDVTQIGRSFLKPLEYETIELKQEWEVIPHATFSPSKARQLAGARLGAAASSLSDRRGTFAPPSGKPPLVRLEDERFLVVSSVDMTPRPAVTEATTKGGAVAALNDWLNDHPEDAGALQVVPLDEAA